MELAASLGAWGAGWVGQVTGVYSKDSCSSHNTVPCSARETVFHTAASLYSHKNITVNARHKILHKCECFHTEQSDYSRYYWAEILVRSHWRLVMQTAVSEIIFLQFGAVWHANITKLAHIFKSTFCWKFDTFPCTIFTFVFTCRCRFCITMWSYILWHICSLFID